MNDHPRAGVWHAAYKLFAGAALALATAGPAWGAQPYGPVDPLRETRNVSAAPRSGALPASITLDQALEEAEARSPLVTAAAAEVAAARGRLRQAGLRPNPDVSVEVENFAGSGPYSGFDGTETTVSINQRLDLGGRRSARVSLAQVQLELGELRLAIARADLAKSVRTAFGEALAADARLEVAQGNLTRVRELSRIASELVDAGREPPLRAYRAKANLARSEAALKDAQGDEAAARRILGAVLGSDQPVGRVAGKLDYARPAIAAAGDTLDVRLASLGVAAAQAGLKLEQAQRRLDPIVGVGMRRLSETGDKALVASFSMPLQLFDRNQGNIAAARSEILAAEARRSAALVDAGASISNAETRFDAALARVKALEDVAVPQADAATRLADLAYRAGKIPLTELIDAQESFAAAQSELIDAHLALVEARASLARAAAK